MKRKAATILLTLTGAAALSLPQTASACSVCFGDPEAPVSKGIFFGIIALGGVVGLMLLGIACFFFFTIRRAAAIEKAANDQLVSENQNTNA